MVTMVTLKDGTQVPEAILRETTQRITTLKKQNYVALFDLVEKCKNAEYKFLYNPFGDSKASLTKLTLMDENGNVCEDVRKVVLNSVGKLDLSLKLVNPLLVQPVNVL